MKPEDVTAVIVTRGDVPLDEIWDSFPEFGQVIVWTNGRGVRAEGPGSFFAWDAGTLDLETMQPVFPDLSVYGRYRAIENAQLPVVYVQDDDCIVPDIPGLLARYRPGEIVANMPESRWPDYPDSCLVGWGAVFDRELPARAFERAGFDPRVSPYPDGDWERYTITVAGRSWTWPSAAAFRRDCDVVFTTLTPQEKVDLGFSHLPWAETPGRLFKEPGHKAARDAMLQAARAARDAA